MESFFSQQFDDILKQFGFGSGFGQFGQIPGQQDEENLGNRDFMLRKDDHPGYIQRERGQPKQDSEIDKVNPEDLKRLYDPIPKAPQIHPGRDSSPFQGFPGDHHGQVGFLYFPRRSIVFVRECLDVWQVHDGFIVLLDQLELVQDVIA